MRRTPYTDKGILRIPCMRCGRPSCYNWNVCALGKGYFGICVECDALLNEVVIRFFKIKGWKKIMKEYRGG